MRVAPLPCSKEIYPVGIHPYGIDMEMRPKVAGHYLLEKMCLAGAEKAYIILSPGKWDIPAYFSDGKIVDMSLAYLVLDSSPGVPFTLDQAYPFVRDATVVFGFPDILFHPHDAFVRLVESLSASKADLVLGLFPADQPHKVDMVELDDLGRIAGISIKPRRTALRYTWLIAAWQPTFTRFLHNFVQVAKDSCLDESAKPEIFLGDVIQAAILEAMPMEQVVFKDGKYLDIGTPEDMAKAVRLRDFTN